jgi:hypothetical protein
VVTVADTGVSESGMLFGLPFASSGVGSTCCSARLLASSWLGFGVEVAGLGAAVQRTVVVLVVGAAGRWGLRAERRGWGGRSGLRKEEAAMTDDGMMSGLLGRHERMRLCDLEISLQTNGLCRRAERDVHSLFACC